MGTRLLQAGQGISWSPLACAAKFIVVIHTLSSMMHHGILGIELLSLVPRPAPFFKLQATKSWAGARGNKAKNSYQQREKLAKQKGEEYVGTAEGSCYLRRQLVLLARYSCMRSILLW